MSNIFDYEQSELLQKDSVSLNGADISIWREEPAERIWSVSEDDRRTAKLLGNILCRNLSKNKNDLKAVSLQVTESL
jgi:hypothetical protein